MIPGPYPHVDTPGRISFAEALATLQAMLGRQVNVEFNDHDRFVGCGFSGKLERVQTLPPDHSAVRIVVSDGSLFLDPAEATAHTSGPDYLEFWVDSGPTITIEVPSE
jgi:hypothetical protein